MIPQTARGFRFLADYAIDGVPNQMGIRTGEKGAHTSRTIMLQELTSLFDAAPASASRDDYARAIVDENCLGKATTSSRRLTRQRLSEMYGLDPAIPVFRILRCLWNIDKLGRPLLALLTALARDPLLAATALSVISLKPGEEFQRGAMREALRESVGERLNDASLDKVVRNAASSWTQSGHLKGRTFKIRQTVQPTPSCIAFALFLAHATGFRGEELLASPWISVLDCSPFDARQLAVKAKRLGLINLRMSAEIFEVNTERLDPFRSGS